MTRVRVGTRNPSVQTENRGSGGWQSLIQFEDEGVALGVSGTVTEVDFVGSGVSAARSGDKVTVTLSTAPPVATQAEVNTGTETAKYVSPATLAGWTGGSGVSGLTATRVPYAQNAVTLIDSANLTWDNTNAALTVNAQRILAKGTNGAKAIHLGYNAGNTTAITFADGFNTSFGYGTLNAIQDAAGAGTFYDASYNAVFGYEAGLSMTRGASNVLMGYRAGRSITTGLGNVGIGKDVLRLLTGSSSSNTAIGYLTLDQMTGSENTAVGASALSGAGTGTRNVAMGYICLTSVTNGSNNVGVGSEVFEKITTQGNNTGVGFWSGVYNKGSNNVAIGAYAMGQATLDSTNDASYNTIVGPSAGSFIAQGDYNTWIGYDTGTAGTGEVYSNTIAIGKAAKVTETNSCVIGGTADANRNNYGFGGEGYGSGRGVLYIKNATTNASAAGANGIIIHSKDSSGGSANATLALYLEEAPEATASFTQSHRLKVWINGTEFYLSLDAV